MTPENLFCLFLGVVIGAGTVMALWAVDRWRNRPLIDLSDLEPR